MSVNYFNISGGNFDSGYQEPLNFHLVILLLELCLGEVIRGVYRALSVRISIGIFLFKKEIT